MRLNWTVPVAPGDDMTEALFLDLIEHLRERPAREVTTAIAALVGSIYADAPTTAHRQYFVSLLLAAIGRAEDEFVESGAEGGGGDDV